MGSHSCAGLTRTRRNGGGFLNGSRACLHWSGSGDAGVAGFLSPVVDYPEEWAHAVARGVAWGALKVQEVSSQLQSLEGLPDVTLTDSPEHGRMLLEPGVI